MKLIKRLIYSYIAICLLDRSESMFTTLSMGMEQATEGDQILYIKRGYKTANYVH